jgi:hypothetical protein
MVSGYDKKRRLAASVGFLTAGETSVVSSAILVSSDPKLVYVFDPDKKDRTTDGLAPAFRIHSPMFGRQLIWESAYGLGAKRQMTTLRKFPDC